jgi:hypothetical protein
MSLLKLDPFPGFSKSLEKNKWADFIEFLCLEAPDKEISLNDITSMYSREGVPDNSNGDEDQGERDDKTRAQFIEIFRYIFSRMDFLSDFYPFVKIDEDSIKMVDVIDEKKLLYFFLLFSSNTSYITDLQIPPFLRMSFERISIDIMKIMYPNFRNELFGTSAKRGECFYGGSLINKLKKLSDFLGTPLTDRAKKNLRYRSPSGDVGLDIISFFQIDKPLCTAPMLPVCIGQCTTSYGNWYNKQLSIKYSSLSEIFQEIAIYHELLFISFSLRGINGNWSFEEATKIQTIIIDRIRFLNILSSVEKTTVLNDEISNYMIELLRNYNVKF